MRASFWSQKPILLLEIFLREFESSFVWILSMKEVDMSRAFPTELVGKA